MDIKALSLFQLNQNIKNVVKTSFDRPVWVIAEISDLKQNRNGHCYLELVEKEEKSDRVKARSRAIIWAYTYRMLKPYFETSTGQLLQSGIKILVQVTIEFHEQYGFNLEIKDIEPSFTIGDIEKQKKEILEALLAEGVIDMNKETDLALCPQKIAIISSPTAAGYTDFINQLENNPYGYVFYTRLFPTVMQGNETEMSMTSAFERIYEYEDFFDAVVIIRGGGASIDLNCFNNYNLAFLVTQFPLPVLTGIGHEKDETILDAVAFQKLKTPTAVAEYLIDRLNAFEGYLNDLNYKLTDEVNSQLNHKGNKLSLLAHKLNSVTNKKLSSENVSLERIRQSIPLHIEKLVNRKKSVLQKHFAECSRIFPAEMKKKRDRLLQFKNATSIHSRNYLKNQMLHLVHTQNILSHLDPYNVLKRGYSITYKDSKPVLSVKSLKKGDKIETLLYHGKVKSTVTDGNAEN